MADQNEYLEATSQSIFLYSTDEQLRKMCRNRVEYYQDLHNYERHIAKQETIITEQLNALSEKDTIIVEKDNTIAEKDNIIADLLAQIQKITAEKETQ